MLSLLVAVALAHETIWVAPEGSTQVVGLVEDVRDVDGQCEVVLSDLSHGWGSEGVGADRLVVQAKFFTRQGSAGPCPRLARRARLSPTDFYVHEGDRLRAILVQDALYEGPKFRLVETVSMDVVVSDPWWFHGETQVLPPGSTVEPTPHTHEPKPKIVVRSNVPIDLSWADRCRRALRNPDFGGLSDEEHLELTLGRWVRTLDPSDYPPALVEDWRRDQPCTDEAVDRIVARHQEHAAVVAAKKAAKERVTDLTHEPDDPEFPEE